MADQPSTSSGLPGPSLRNVLEVEKQVRNKTRFSAEDVVHFIMLPTQDSDCDLSDGDEEDVAQIDEESRIAEVSHNVDCLDYEDDTASLDDVTDSAQGVTGDPPPAKKR